MEIQYRNVNTDRNEEVRVVFLHVKTLLADRMGSVNNGPYVFFLARFYHFPPGKLHAGIGHDAVDDSNYFLSRETGKPLYVRTPVLQNLGMCARKFEGKR